MDDLKVITASNIINLRTARGMTQAELGELLNYSDKSVSKWERAEAVPDAYVLKKMSGIFGVSVDYLLESHDEWKPPKMKNERNYSSRAVTNIALIGIWTFALLVYVIGMISGENWWMSFIYAIPVSLITLLVLNSVWEEGKNNRFIVYALIASLFLTAYAAFLKSNPWQILLLIVPAEIIAGIAFRIKKPHK